MSYTGRAKKEGLLMFWANFQNSYFVRILDISKINVIKKNQKCFGTLKKNPL